MNAGNHRCSQEIEKSSFARVAFFFRWNALVEIPANSWSVPQRGINQLSVFGMVMWHAERKYSELTQNTY